MPLYQYRCSQCKRLFNVETRADAMTCPDCAANAPRRFSFYTSTSMKEHFNQAVGQYVSNRHEMSEALKRQSEEASVRTGIDHQYEMVEPSEMADPSAHGVVLDESLNETRRRQHDNPELFVQ